MACFFYDSHLTYKRQTYSSQRISHNLYIDRNSPFSSLKSDFEDVLDAVALFNIRNSLENGNIFRFISEAILERNKNEGSQLFTILLNWYFGTATPYCSHAILTLFVKLTKLSYLKKAVAMNNRTSDFVAEFGRSDSYDIARVNAEILQNIKSHLTEDDCRRIVDFSISNNQIFPSFKAREYLIKILPYCQGR